MLPVCVEENRKEQSIKKYGTDHPQKSKKVKEKMTNTNLKKYGVSNVFQNPDIIQKIKDTNMERYGETTGMRVPEIVEKQRLTIQKKYGVDNAMKNKQIREKASQTCMDRYGVRNPSQHEPFYRKANDCRKKPYELPSGKVIQLQGYENYALDILLEDYDEEDIVADDRNGIPMIRYRFEGEFHKFFSDFYIPRENKIIEVKSSYTYDKFKEKNEAKLEWTPIRGYNIEYWIINKKGKLEEVIYRPAIPPVEIVFLE